MRHRNHVKITAALLLARTERFVAETRAIIATTGQVMRQPAMSLAMRPFIVAASGVMIAKRLPGVSSLRRVVFD